MAQLKENTEEEIQGNWLQKKIYYFKNVIRSLLTQGISPTKISLAIAIGFISGTFPILGTHTILAIALAFVFRLNQVAVFLGTWISAPIYFILLLPSLRIGEYLLKSETLDMDIFVSNLKIMTRSYDDFVNVWIVYGKSILHTIIGWVPMSILVGVLVYFITLHLARLVLSRKESRKNAQL